MSNVLLLNVTHEPLRVISLKRAMVLVLQDKAEIIEGDLEDPVRSATDEYPRPKVVKLRYFVKIPFSARAPLNRKNLMVRDRGKCAYCGGHGSTIDHVIPRAKGGKHTWENVVLSCSPCNQRKGDKLLSQLGWELEVTPTVPATTVAILIGFQVDPAWEPHLQLAGC